MALSDIDRNLLQRCLDRKPRAWEDFVDRFLGLVMHVITHTAKARSIRLSAQDGEDVAAEVFLTLVVNDFKTLRRFRGDSSLATYLTVVSRRVVVRELLRRKKAASLTDAARVRPNPTDRPEKRITDREEVERLIAGLKGVEAEVVRMYHLDGKTYEEISTKLNVSTNSVGPTLTRARKKMQRLARKS